MEYRHLVVGSYHTRYQQLVNVSRVSVSVPPLMVCSGGRGKIKLKLTTFPRHFIRAVCRFNSIAFAMQRSLAYPSVPMATTACPCRPLPLLLHQHKLPGIYSSRALILPL